MGNPIKQRLIASCESYVDVRLQTIQKAIDDLEAALKLETKCSMGDKYETGRAMLHLEFEKLARQYEEYKKLQKTVKMIPGGRIDSQVSFGSVVKTSRGNYFISVPAGKIPVEGEDYYAVGANAPVAKILLSRIAGDTVTFNGAEMEILEVL